MLVRSVSTDLTSCHPLRLLILLLHDVVLLFTECLFAFLDFVFRSKKPRFAQDEEEEDDDDESFVVIVGTSFVLASLAFGVHVIVAVGVVASVTFAAILFVPRELHASESTGAKSSCSFF